MAEAKLRVELIFTEQVSACLPHLNFVFLDGGNNPREQIEEFRLLDPRMPPGSILMAHDALLREGKWLRRALYFLDHFETTVLPISPEGLLVAKKLKANPSFTSSLVSELVLFASQFSPLELAARLIPHKLRALVFSLLPKKLGA